MKAQLVMTQRQVAAHPDKWQAYRREGVTASEIPSIVGFTPKYGSAFSVYEAKVNGWEFDADTDATLRGRHLESYVAERFAAEYGYHVSDGGLFRSERRPWQMATLDRIAWTPESIVDEVAFPVQVKTSASYDGWGEDGSDEIPRMYRAQCLFEMDTYEADMILVPCLFVHTWKLRLYVIYRTPAVEEAIGKLRAAGEEFMTCLRTGTEPEIDWTPATTRALHAMMVGEPDGTVEIPVKLARRYKAARKSVEAAKRRQGLAVNQILRRAGSARYVVTASGEKVATISRSNPRRTDLDKLRKDHADIAKIVEYDGDTVVTLHPGKFAK